MKKSLILLIVILQLFCDYTKSYKIHPRNTYNVQNYISNNEISPDLDRY